MSADDLDNRAAPKPTVIGDATLTEGYAQAMIDQSDREVRRVAKKAGVPDEWFEAARQAFAREMLPHAGREPSTHSTSHYRKWFKGFAAGLRAHQHGRECALRSAVGYINQESLAAAGFNSTDVVDVFAVKP